MIFTDRRSSGKAATALDAEVAAADKNTITVENVAGNSHYCYTPYELADPTGDAVQNLLDTQKIGDCGILNGEIREKERIPIRRIRH